MLLFTFRYILSSDDTSHIPFFLLLLSFLLWFGKPDKQCGHWKTNSTFYCPLSIVSVKFIDWFLFYSNTSNHNPFQVLVRDSDSNSMFQFNDLYWNFRIYKCNLCWFRFPGRISVLWWKSAIFSWKSSQNQMSNQHSFILRTHTRINRHRNVWKRNRKSLNWIYTTRYSIELTHGQWWSNFQS